MLTVFDELFTLEEMFKLTYLVAALITRVSEITCINFMSIPFIPSDIQIYETYKRITDLPNV